MTEQSEHDGARRRPFRKRMRNPDRREHRIGIPLPYLYDWRVSQLITQEDLGKRAGISGSAISQIEGALVNASFGSVRRLADALGITVEQLRFERPAHGPESE